MQRFTSHRRRFVIAAAVALSAVGMIGVTGVPSASATVPPAPGGVGVVCTDGPTFNLETAKDYITLPDGNTAYMYGYKIAGGHFQHPSPVLCVNQNQQVTITLKNTLSRAVSIMFPGQHDVMANGLPANPEVDGGGVVSSLTNSVAPGGTITYSFVADHPGTFLYESGTDGDVQVRMGLFGALIVRPAGHADYVYGTADSQFTTTVNSPGAVNPPVLMVPTTTRTSSCCSPRSTRTSTRRSRSRTPAAPATTTSTTTTPVTGW